MCARAVIALHGAQRGDARHDPFRPAGKARKEMRLDEAGDDPHVGLGEVAIEQRGRAGAA